MLALLVLFLVLRLGQQLAEHTLAALNRSYWRDPARQAEAGRILRIPGEEMRKAVAYASDRYQLGRIAEWTEVLATLTFIALGGLGWAEGRARALVASLGGGPVVTGLAFFGILGLLGALLGLPFVLYATFVIEERHGFNRQTWRGFLVDQLKGLVLAVALGAPLLAAVLTIMEKAGPWWWLWAWAATSGFSLFTAWIYPRVLAPVFNRFSPLPTCDLRGAIPALA